MSQERLVTYNYRPLLWTVCFIDIVYAFLQIGDSVLL